MSRSHFFPYCPALLLFTGCVIYLEVYFGMFPLFESDRFTVFKKGDCGTEEEIRNKEGEREGGSRRRIFSRSVCLHVFAVRYSTSALMNTKSAFHMLVMRVHPGRTKSSTIQGMLISPLSPFLSFTEEEPRRGVRKQTVEVPSKDNTILPRKKK